MQRIAYEIGLILDFTERHWQWFAFVAWIGAIAAIPLTIEVLA